MKIITAKQAAAKFDRLKLLREQRVARRNRFEVIFKAIQNAVNINTTYTKFTYSGYYLVYPSASYSLLPIDFNLNQREIKLLRRLGFVVTESTGRIDWGT